MIAGILSPKSSPEPKWCICEGGPDMKIGESFHVAVTRRLTEVAGLLAGTLIQNFSLQEAKFPAYFSTMR
jgi:hypothetical protein